MSVIRAKPTIDSAQWMHLLSPREETNACLDCEPDYRLNWKIGGNKKSLGYIIESIRTKGHKDALTEGIWSHMPTKFSIFLWRVKSRDITTFTMLST